MSPDEKIPSSSGWSATAWHDGWPAAQIGGVMAVRLMILPGPGGSVKDPHAWQLTAVHEPEKNAVEITGEMIRTCGPWFLTVAATAIVRFQPGEAPPMTTDDELDDVLLRYGPWASHPLWDYCRLVLLQAASAFPVGAGLEIAQLTPEPKCITRKIQREGARRRRRKSDTDEAP